MTNLHHYGQKLKNELPPTVQSRPRETVVSYLVTVETEVMDDTLVTQVVSTSRELLSGQRDVRSVKINRLVG